MGFHETLGGGGGGTTHLLLAIKDRGTARDVKLMFRNTQALNIGYSKVLFVPQLRETPLQ